MRDRTMHEIGTGSRADMAAAERWLSERIPDREEALGHVGTVTDDVPWFLTARLFGA
jgi:alpha/beta superfamily hydrolase